MLVIVSLCFCGDMGRRKKNSEMRGMVESGCEGNPSLLTLPTKKDKNFLHYREDVVPLERFAAECDAVEERISTSKSETMVLSQKIVECPL